MAKNEMTDLKVERALRDLMIEAPEDELRSDLAEAGEDFDALVACARGVVHRALGSVSAKTEGINDLHRGLGALIRMLRRRDGLSIEELARVAVVDIDELKTIEMDPTRDPRPRTIYQLERCFRLPARSLVVLSGAGGVRTEVRSEAVQFAASSGAMSKLNKEEMRLLTEFVRFLAAQTDR